MFSKYPLLSHHPWALSVWTPVPFSCPSVNWAPVPTGDQVFGLQLLPRFKSPCIPKPLVDWPQYGVSLNEEILVPELVKEGKLRTH